MDLVPGSEADAVLVGEWELVGLVVELDAADDCFLSGEASL